MFGQRLADPRQGDRAEYLAHYILSGIAVCVPVPRQEDFGIDFHCGLLRRVGLNLQPYLAFNVQIKKSSSPPEPLQIGGFTSGGEWRQHVIEEFCFQEIPFLLGIMDVGAQRLDLFSTITRHFLGRWYNRELPNRVDLIPYEPSNDQDLNGGEIEDISPTSKLAGRKLKLRLGQPIVQIGIADSEDDDKREEIKRAIEPYLWLDQQNILYRRLGLGHWIWPLRPGANPNICGVGHTALMNDLAMDHLCRIVANLLGTYQALGRKEKIKPWIGIVNQLPLQRADPVTKDWIERAVTFANGRLDEGCCS